MTYRGFWDEWVALHQAKPSQAKPEDIFGMDFSDPPEDIYASQYQIELIKAAHQAGRGVSLKAIFPGLK